MKILIVASPWLGGSGTLAFELAESLSRHHQTYFLSFDYPIRQPKKHNFLFVNIVPATYAIFSSPLYQTSLAERIVEICQKYQIEIIHAHYSIVFGEAAVEAKKILQSQGKKIKLVLTFHGTDAVGFKPENPGAEAFKNINRWLIEESDIVTTPSLWMKKFMEDYYCPKKTITVVPNFYDDEVFKCRNDLTTRNYFIHVSNLRMVKRPLEAVKAFQETKRKLPDGINLLIVGEGPEKNAINEYIKREGVKNVLSRGKSDKEELVHLYNQSLGLILPSTFENQPLAILEAAACGVPTIATNVGGVSEILQDEVTGFVIKDTQNPQPEIAKRMVEVVNNPILWQILSDNAVCFAQNFTKDKIVGLYENLYQGQTNRWHRLNHILKTKTPRVFHNRI